MVSSRRVYKQEWYTKNRKRILKSKVVYKRRNPKNCLLNSAKARAKRDKILFDITLEDIVIPEYCPILGIKLEYIPGQKMTSPSLDRVDNTKGYTKNNIRVISTRANSLKGNMTKEDIGKLYEYVSNHEKQELLGS